MHTDTNHGCDARYDWDTRLMRKLGVTQDTYLQV